MNNSLLCSEENKKSLQEIADYFNISYDTVQRHAQKLGFTQNGVKTFLDKAQCTLLLEDMQNTNNRTDLPSTTVIEGSSTTLTPALKIKRAMELMQEGYEEELQILRGKVTELTPKKVFFLSRRSKENAGTTKNYNCKRNDVKMFRYIKH